MKRSHIALIAVLVLGVLASTVLFVEAPERKIVSVYTRIPCQPAENIGDRTLSSPIKFSLPKRFSEAKASLQVYEPTWIDSRHMPRSIDELSFSEPEDAALALKGHVALRRGKAWLQRCSSGKYLERFTVDVKSLYAKRPKVSYEELDGRLTPLRYYYRLNLTTKGENYVFLYFDRLKADNAGKGGPGGHGPLGAFIYKKHADGWKRDVDIKGTQLGSYLSYEVQPELLKLAPFSNIQARKVDK